MWKQLWNLVIGRDWKILRCILEKADIAVERHLKAVLVTSQREKRRAVEKIFVVFENTYHIQYVGRTVDGKGHSGEVSDRNEELAIGERVVLVIKWQRTWLNCVLVSVFCGR